MQRRGDVARLGPQHIRNGVLCVRQRKTGAVLTLPILPELQDALDVTPCGHLTFMTTVHGQPFEAHNFGTWFARACADAGLRGFSAHGLRKAGCRRLAEFWLHRERDCRVVRTQDIERGRPLHFGR